MDRHARRGVIFLIILGLGVIMGIAACGKSAGPSAAAPPIRPLGPLLLTPGTATRTGSPTPLALFTQTAPAFPTRGSTSTPAATNSATSKSNPIPVPSETPTLILPSISNVQSSAWSLVFADDFNNDHLNTNKWVTCYWWDKQGCTNTGNHELEWYQPHNVTVQGGNLILEARRQRVVGSDGKVYPYTSGMVTTGRADSSLSTPVKFDFQYGFVEIKAKVPAGKGLWPAFWLLPANNTAKPELDVLELLGDKPGTAHVSLHYLSNGSDTRIGNSCTSSSYAGSWHTFGMDWEPDHITWYIDGVKCWEYSDTAHIPAEKMYLLLNLAVGGGWPGNPDANTPFPSTFQIDYVRVWQRAK